MVDLHFLHHDMRPQWYLANSVPLGDRRANAIPVLARVAQTGQMQDGLTVTWVATRDIEYGEEIFWPYGLTPAEGDEWEGASQASQTQTQTQRSQEAKRVLALAQIPSDSVVEEAINTQIATRDH